MAIVNGPLFSLDASGKLADALVYGKWKGRATVRRWVTPANPRTILQTYARGALSALADWWSVIDADDRETWRSLAEDANISPFDAYMRAGLLRFAANEGPQMRADGGGTPDDGNVLDLTIIAGERSLIATIEWDQYPDAGSLALLTLWPTFIPAFNPIQSVIGHRIATTPGDMVLHVKNLQPGTYYGYAGVIGPDGETEGFTSTSGTFTIT